MKDEDINVNHETKSSGSILLTDDAVLVEIIWAEFFDVELHLTIETSQKPFSSWHFTDVKSFLNLEVIAGNNCQHTKAQL